MAIKKKYHKKIEEGFKHIFKTEIQKETPALLLGFENGLVTQVNEPLVKHQIIQLAKLCQEVPSNVSLKAQGNNNIAIEFW